MRSEVVRALLEQQFPAWADLSVAALDPGAGTDHDLVRLGPDLVARFPRSAEVAGQVEKERRWLPYLAPSSPVGVPVPVGHGAPGPEYPWSWSVSRWLPGVDATQVAVTDTVADDLAAFVRALWRLDAAPGPPPGAHNGRRGVPLAERRAEVTAALADLAALDLGVDILGATAVWRDALAAPVHDGPARWLHGDLLPGNVLVADGRLSAVIDFGLLGVGDPACDLMAAWTVLPASARARFRAAVGADDATWRRARGWAVSWALIALPHHDQRTPALAAVARRTLGELTCRASWR